MTREEVWLDIPSYEGLYQCSNLGRVKSLDRKVLSTKKVTFEKFLRGGIRKQQDRVGYKVVTLFKNGNRKTHYVHRLVAKVFIPNPNNYPMVNHKDEDRTNNKVENLEWCTHQYNLNYGTSLKRKNKKLSTPIVGVHVETGKKITFPSMMEAGRNGFSQPSISACCNNKQESHKKYKWKFKTKKEEK